MARLRSPKLEDVKTEVRLKGIEHLLDEIDDLTDLFFVKWGDVELCCDRLNDWAFADFLVPDDTGNPFSQWMIITPGFATLEEALDFPVLDGKSVRERFDECRFFME